MELEKMKPQTLQRPDYDVAKILYIRLPHTIKSAKEIEDLFPGDVQVKLTRQSARHCHVVFPSVEEKMKNLKRIRKIKINGKNILACPPRINPPQERKKKEKKIRIPKPEVEEKITKTLHVSNIKLGTKAKEIKDAFPGCVSVAMIKSKNTANGIAMVKLGSLQLAAEYLRKERESPVVRGNKLVIRLDTRKRKKKPGKKSSGLKIYDGDTEEDNKTVSKKENKSPKSNNQKSEESQESENEDDEENEDEEEDEESDSDKCTDVEEE